MTANVARGVVQVPVAPVDVSVLWDRADFQENVEITETTESAVVRVKMGVKVPPARKVATDVKVLAVNEVPRAVEAR